MAKGESAGPVLSPCPTAEGRSISGSLLQATPQAEEGNGTVLWAFLVDIWQFWASAGL